MRIWYANIFVVIVLGLQLETEAQGMTDNRAEGEAFLVENAQREGVVALPSGLQYEVLTEGDGAATWSCTIAVRWLTARHSTVPSPAASPPGFR